VVAGLRGIALGHEPHIADARDGADAESKDGEETVGPHTSKERRPATVGNIVLTLRFKPSGELPPDVSYAYGRSPAKPTATYGCDESISKEIRRTMRAFETQLDAMLLGVPALAGQGPGEEAGPIPACDTPKS
jgi:hypothetical protein